MTRPGSAHWPENPQAQRGIAVIGALMVVAAVAVTSAMLLDQQSTMVRALEVERDRLQAQWVLRAGLDWARLTLFNDARRSSVTRSDGLWAQPIVGLQIDIAPNARMATFSGHIEDEQSKFNLNDLAINGRIQGDEVSRLGRLLRLINVASGKEHQLAQLIADSQSSQGPLGTRAYARSVDEVLTRLGVAADQISLLGGYLTLLPRGVALNINTASPEMLSATIGSLDLLRARDAVRQRNRGQWFSSVGEFLNRLSLPTKEFGRHLGIDSQWFMVSGVTELDNARMQMQAILYRPKNEVPVVRWMKE